MEVQDLLKRAQDMLVTPASPPKVVVKAKQQVADTDDWVDLHEDADGSDSGWTTPSCSSSQPGSPRGAAPAPAPAKAAPSTAIAAPPSKAKAGAKTLDPAAQEKGSSAAAVAPESPPQVSECASLAQAAKEKDKAAAAAAGLTEADLHDLKAMMTDMKGDIGRCTQVAEQALATHSRPGPGGRGQFAWRVGAHPPMAAAPAAPPAAPEPVHRGPPLDLTDYLEVDVDLVQEQCSKDGFVINLKPKAGGRGVRLFVGDFEGSSLVRAVTKKVKTQHGRPMTYDFVKSSFEELGFKVAAVQVTAFINNTYHSLVHYEGRPAGLLTAAVDARPSDAINLALRFGAPVYVAKKVLAR